MWPILVQWNGLILYSYPLFIGLAWGLGFRLCESQLPVGISSRGFALWFAGLFISSWIGAKLLFTITQDQYSVIDLVTASNFWLGGGFVFLGGFLGGLVFTFIASLANAKFSWPNMQFTIVPLLWSHAIGRLGCFLAGCCFGTETNLPWSIHLHGAARHPVQIYEAMALAILALALSKWRFHQRFLMAYLLGYGALRWSLEWLRADEVRGVAWAMSTSQWVALGMIVLGLSLYFQSLRHKNTLN